VPRICCGATEFGLPAIRLKPNIPPAAALARAGFLDVSSLTSAELVAPPFFCARLTIGQVVSSIATLLNPDFLVSSIGRLRTGRRRGSRYSHNSVPLLLTGCHDSNPNHSLPTRPCILVTRVSRVNGLVRTSMPCATAPQISMAALCAYPVMNSTGKVGRTTRAASAR
jgi:hypothetical protein